MEMEGKAGLKTFFDYVPAFKIRRIVLATYALQFLLFLFLVILFWWSTSKFWISAIVIETIVCFFGTLPYRYMANNIEKIRTKYRSKYDRLAAQKLWFNYQSYTIPLFSSSMYFPIMLYNYDLIPPLIKLPSNIITNPIFPFYIAIPLGITVVILGILIRRPSGGFDADIDTYLYLMFPENGRLLISGMYQYIRNPRYLAQGILSVGLGIISNNLLAILVGFMHSVVFCSLIIPEDKELIRRFGKDFEEYKKRVPALFPRYGNWMKFFRYVFAREKK